MKRIILSMLLVLSAFVANSQKSDYVWTIGENVIDFNYEPPIVKDFMKFGNNYNLSCLSDADGHLLFSYCANRLYDANGNVIKTDMGALAHGNALIPCPGDAKHSLLFHHDQKVFRYGILDNSTNQYTDKATLPYLYYTFVSKKGSEDIWLIATNKNTDKLEISLITNAGIQSPAIFDRSEKMYRAEVSNDGTKIFTSKKVYAFDNENGKLGEVLFSTESDDCVFTKSGKYLYSFIVSDIDNKKASIVRYKIDNVYKDQEFIANKEVLLQEVLTPYDIKLGPDGNVYFLDGSSMSVIKNVDSDKPQYVAEVIKLKSSLKYFPFTFHYTPSSSAIPSSGSHTVCQNSITEYFIENPVTDSKYVWNISPSGMGEVVSNSESYDKISVKWKNVGDAEISVYEVNSSGCNSDASSIEVSVLESPDAQFDNASLCYGEPLNVILSGVAPFTLDYTLDGEAFSVPDISANIYRMPDTPGKYSILKVSDKNCSSAPEKNNNAVIGNEMKKLKIKIGE